MRARGPHPLFHAIVSMGALLSAPGCGGVETGSTGSSGNGDPSNGSGGENAGSPATTGGATATSSGGASATGGAPSGSGDASPADAGACREGTVYDCTVAKRCACRGDVSVTECRSPTQHFCSLLDPTNCWCDPDAPEFPDDCQNTAQFTCAEWAPTAKGCHCDTGAPTQESDCPPCAAFSCHSYSPPVDCRCVICIR